MQIILVLKIKIIIDAGGEIKDSSNEVLSSCNLLIKVNCPSDNED